VSMFCIIDDLRIRIIHNFRGRLVFIQVRCPSFEIIRPFILSHLISSRRRMRNRGFLIILHLFFVRA
jgi:hypothetical protein